MGTCCSQEVTEHGRPVVRMCVPEKELVKIADIGDRVVLFVDFGLDYGPGPTNDRGHGIASGVAAIAGLQSTQDSYQVRNKWLYLQEMGVGGRGVSKGV